MVREALSPPVCLATGFVSTCVVTSCAVPDARELRSLESILRENRGVDDPEKLKRFHYEEWRQRGLGYALLVGGRHSSRAHHGIRTETHRLIHYWKGSAAGRGGRWAAGDLPHAAEAVNVVPETHVRIAGILVVPVAGATALRAKSPRPTAHHFGPA